MAVVLNGNNSNLSTSSKVTGTTLASGLVVVGNGDLVIVGFSALAGSGTYSCADDQLNTYSVLKNVSNGTTITTYFFCAVAGTSPSFTITLTHPSPPPPTP